MIVLILLPENEGLTHEREARPQGDEAPGRQGPREAMPTGDGQGSPGRRGSRETRPQGGDANRGWPGIPREAMPMINRYILFC